MRDAGETSHPERSAAAPAAAAPIGATTSASRLYDERSWPTTTASSIEPS